MTVKQIETIIDNECAKHPGCSDNGGCPLKDSTVHCSRINDEDCTQAEANELYELLLGKKPDEHCEPLDHPVLHPSHYTQGNIQCIDAMESAFGKEAVATWCKLNSFKYIWRSEHKNGMEDIDKAIWYLNKFKELSASG